MEAANNMRTQQQRAAALQCAKKRLDGVSNTVLASALRELESDGLIERREYLEVPVRVEYSTTQACDKLIPILEGLSDWAEGRMA